MNIDHKAESLRLMEFNTQADAGMTVEEIQVSATMAQAQATLHLAEQQRIANLIALLQLDEGDVSDFGTRGVIWTQVSAEIVNGLGLA